MSNVRIAFIGCGMMGQSVHLRNFLKIPDCDIVAICDLRRELADAVASKHRIPASFASHAEMLRHVDCDAVACINHAHIHWQIAIDCCNADKHVFVEKPMCMSTSDGLAMCAAAKANNVQLMVAHMKRYDSGFRLAKQRIDAFCASGELGRPTHARVHYFCGDWMANYNEPRVTVKDENPGDAAPARRPDWMPEAHARPWWGFLQQFCHGTNMLRFLWGDPTEVRYAKWDDFANRPGYFTTVLRQPAGFDCIFEGGAMRSHFWDEYYKLYFEKGLVKVSATPPLLQQTPARIEVYRSDPPAFEIPPADWGWAFENEARAFVEACKTNQPPPTVASDTIRDTFLCERLYLANRENRAVPIDWSEVPS